MKKSTLKNVIVLTVSVVSSLVLIEGASRIIYNRQVEIASNHTGVLNVPDAVLGYRARANASGVDEGMRGGKLKYRVTYTTNEYGRRIVPRANSKDRSRFIALFGCSMTFGVGIEDDETLAAHLAKLAPDCMPYNFAYQGYGTQHLLLTMQEPIENEIEQKSGVGIYVYFIDQTRRLIGRPHILAAWGADFPAYRLENGKLVLTGSFAATRPWWVASCRLAEKSRAVRLLRKFLPDYTPYNLELTARVIAEARDLFQKKFPGSPFYVAIPYCWPDVRQHDPIIPYLDKYNIPVLRGDLARDPEEPVPPLLADAYHPSSLGNQKMAQFLVNRLNLNGPAPQR
jgi:hypothetical protein